MRPPQVLLLSLVVFLFLADALSATEAVKTKTELSATSYSTIAGRNPNGGRSLRIHTQLNEDDDEERAWSDLSAVKAKVRNFLSRMHLKDTASEIEAKKALGLYGLSGKALKSHENYIYWRSEAELAKFNKWAEDGVPTFNAWKKFGLGKVREDQVDALVDNRKFVGYLSRRLAMRLESTLPLYQAIV